MPVKEKKRGRPGRDQGRLTADVIVSCARQLMQAEGKVPSIRRLAGELGVDAMAIYHYFSSKAVLLEAVTVSLVETLYQPQGAAESGKSAASEWQDELAALCQSYLQLLHDCPGLLETLLTMPGGEGPVEEGPGGEGPGGEAPGAGAQADGPVQVFCQRLEQALAPLGLSGGDFNTARDLLADYLHGVAFAMQCNPVGAGQLLVLGRENSPFALICSALEQLADS